jgi:predicted nucleic acid-binding protein
VIFCNTTPLIALSGIGQLDLLSRLFGVIHVVEAVADECAAGGPVAVPDLSSLPWIRLIPSEELDLPGLLLNLDRGERDTLAMARKSGAKRVIIDERIGRNMAELLGLQVTGTLGVLLKAKEQGWIPSFHEAVTQMQRNGIFYQPDLLQKLRRIAGES